MTPTELYEKILRSITQVRNVRNEQGRERMNHAWELYGDVVADDSMLDEMARNAAQALVGVAPRHRRRVWPLQAAHPRSHLLPVH